MCASNSGNLAMVTWRDHQISSCSKTGCSLGKLRHSAISRVSSISQHNIDPCLATLTPWILEILGGKYRERVPVDEAVEWFPQGRKPGRESLLPRPCLWAAPSLHPTPHSRNDLPGAQFQKLGPKPTTAILLCSSLPLKAQQRISTDSHHVHLPELFKSLTFNLSGKLIFRQPRHSCRLKVERS